MRCPNCGTIEKSDTSTECSVCHAALPPFSPPTAHAAASVQAGGGLAQGISVLLWIGTILAALLAAVAYVSSNGAPQQAAAAGLAVIP